MFKGHFRQSLGVAFQGVFWHLISRVFDDGFLRIQNSFKEASGMFWRGFKVFQGVAGVSAIQRAFLNFYFCVFSRLLILHSIQRALGSVLQRFQNLLQILSRDLSTP